MLPSSPANFLKAFTVLVLGSKALSLGIGCNSIYQVTFKSALFWADSNFMDFSFELLSFNAMVSVSTPLSPALFKIRSAVPKSASQILIIITINNKTKKKKLISDAIPTIMIIDRSLCTEVRLSASGIGISFCKVLGKRTENIQIKLSEQLIKK